MLRFWCSPDVSLQDLGSGCISGALKTLKDKETHVGFSGRVISKDFFEKQHHLRALCDNLLQIYLLLERLPDLTNLCSQRYYHYFLLRGLQA